ncbi:penicillin-binding protein 1A [Sterolibacterium denitrificans]|uniref:penicillin-binding protein 1A n=1 Tax=Sterolibacterium denitrificans TaxID=157592 RepID=UPI003B222A38
MSPIFRWPLYLLLLLVGTIAAGMALLGIIVVLAYPQLPSLEVLTDYQPKIPLRVYTADGYLIGEFGEERRALVRISEVPDVMKQAILAAEDERFYTHGGVDTLGVLRAAYSNFIGGGKRQGASTITMQVARNFFLSREKTITRKLYEALLAFKIEHSLSKDEILQLYINQIYLGQRAYGFSSAAQIYYGKALKNINLAEAAMLAGLPKAPSSFNPVANPKRAKQRQLYVLRRMLTLNYISEDAYAEAQNTILTVKRDYNDFGVHAEFVAEMARQIAYEQFQDSIYSRGLKVITTITKAEQEAAYNSLRKGLFDYDRRHGYRGAEGYIDMQAIQTDQDEALEEVLANYEDSDDLRAAVVLNAKPGSVRAYLRGGEIVQITGDGLKFASRMLDEKSPPNKRIRRGAIIRIYKDGKQQWQIGQMPDAEGAFVAASPIDGAIRALVGGFDFNRNKFNHVTQAWRQPGSSFKPFIYSAALEKGYSPSSVLSDEPIVISAAETGSRAWEPKNYDGKYDGPMSLRMGLAKSKNMISIHLLKSIGTQYAQDYITRFGFDADKHPPYLTMALGSGAVTPWQQLTAYAIFANGGYRITPFIVRQILDDKDNVLAETRPAVAGDETLRVIDARNAYLIDSMLHDVVRRGTATKALALKRSDLAGKTGTTNDYVDAWFCGYQPTVVGISWIGFDQPKRLGSGETGGTTALPIWIGFMEKALQGVPENFMEQPEGLVAIDPKDPSGKPGGREYIYAEDLPGANESSSSTEETSGSSLLPSLFPAPAPLPEKQQTPAPVQDARPKPIPVPTPPPIPSPAQKH